MRTLTAALALVLAGGASPSAQVTLDLVPAKGSVVEAGRRLTVVVRAPERSESGLAPDVPAVWIDEHAGSAAALSESACKARIDGYRRGLSFNAPAVDLNIYHLVTLSPEGVVTVLDPRSGFGGSRMVARIDLESPPGSWGHDPESRLLWVAVPRRESVVMVDTHAWRIRREVTIGGEPAIVRVTSGGVWVTMAGARLVRLDTENGNRLEEADAPGPIDDLQFADGVPFAIVQGHLWTRTADGWRDLELRARAIAWSPAAAAAVVLRGDGGVSLLEPDGRTRASMPAASALDERLQLSPDGRWAFAWSPEAADIRVLDLSRSRWLGELHTDAPSELAFTDGSVYVRSPLRPEVLVTPLGALDRPGSIAGRLVAGGTRPHRGVSQRSMAAVPGTGLMFWANKEDRQVFVYHEGMNAASGSLRHPDAPPQELLLTGPPIRRIAPGHFTADVALPKPGRYLLAAYVPQPLARVCRIVHVGGTGPSNVAGPEVTSWILPEVRRAGTDVLVAFETNLSADAPATLQVMAMSASGTWQERFVASRAAGSRRYEALVRAPHAGPHYLVVTIYGGAGPPRSFRRVIEIDPPCRQDEASCR